MKEALGTPIYMAPEVIKKKIYDSKVDVWSATIIVFIMLTGKQPFGGKNKELMFENIVNQELDFKDPLFKNLSAHAIDFLHYGLQKDPSKRGTAY